jgi:hypothetical protein
MDSTQDSAFCAEGAVSCIVAVESGVRTGAITIRPYEEES